MHYISVATSNLVMLRHNNAMQRTAIRHATRRARHAKFCAPGAQ
jgi:hypothetical protein